MSEHQYDISISESCVDPNPLMVERQDPDNFTRFQARERCALEIAAYVFKYKFSNKTRRFFEHFFLSQSKKLLRCSLVYYIQPPSGTKTSTFIVYMSSYAPGKTERVCRLV